MRHLWALLAVLLMTMSACGATGEETAAPADDAAAATGDADAATSGDDATPAGADAVATEGAESGCVPAEAAAGGEARNLTFATGRQGGSQYPTSVALVQLLEGLPSLGTVTLTPGGGAANVVAVNEGQAELGITLALSAVDGYQGRPPYEAPLTDVAHLFSLHPFNLVILAGADSGIDTVEDLRGKSVNVGPAGFTTGVVAELLFEIYGFEPGDVESRNLAITDAADQFKNNQLDALLYMPSDRFAAYIDLAQTRDIQVVPIDEEHRQMLLDAHPSFYETEWPSKEGIYNGLDEPVPTVGFANTIIVNCTEVSEQLGYDMVKAIADGFEQVKAVEPSLEANGPEILAVPVNGMPLHPGAQRYFEEQGWGG